MSAKHTEVTIDNLIKKVTLYDPEMDTDLIRRAYGLAAEAHEGQTRKSGEAYISHPLSVAFILAELQMGDMAIVAALLHDVVEDTIVTLEEVEDMFGQEVAMLVDGVTKLSRIQYKDREEQQVENLRKMLLAMAKDIRVIIIKLADRLHNMRTLKYMSPEKQRNTAQETLEIYAPLSHRLGVFKIKWELEDLALKYLEPDSYMELVKTISMKRKEREDFINLVIDQIDASLTEMFISADIQGRPKHFYSIYNKMVKQHKEISEIYDLIAIRIIVDSVKDCYAVLGIIHTLWKPIPGRFKDYIAMPKPNMYQSLHTTVIGRGGEPFEVQIRTWDMHRTAEFGVAAHWKYKEARKPADNDMDVQFTWLRKTIMDLQSESGDARDFVDTLKTDLFSDRVYVFTPKGDVVELKSGSTPIDFAYRVHTDVGNKCVGARVNGKMVQLDHELQTGDIVEIMTSKTPNPSLDWLKIAATSQAKNKIRNWFKKQNRDKKIELGRDLLARELKRERIDPKYSTEEYMKKMAQVYSMAAVDDMYAAIGDNGLTAHQVAARLRDQIRKESKDDISFYEKSIKPWDGFGKPSKGIRVKGLDNAMVRISRCCNPLPDDEIGGYISRGSGISVHRKDCSNFRSLARHEPQRIIEVAWDTKQDSAYQVRLEVIGINRDGFTLDLMKTIHETKTSINAINARINKDQMIQVDVKVIINDLAHLEHLIQKLNKIRDVINVRRVTPSRQKPRREDSGS